MRRTTRKEREENARQFYAMLQNHKRAAVVVERNDSTTNPYVNRVKFLTRLGSNSAEPMVIAESSSLGTDGCFIEFFESLGAHVQKTMYEDGFDDWLRRTFHFRITYNDGLVMIFEWL